VALTIAAVVVFSLLSGAVYVINDLFDIDKDRLHPRKRHRPIASGKLTLPVARTQAALLIVLSLGSGVVFGLPFFACTASYLIVNLAYSLQLKQVPFVDVLIIASGFLLRVLAGALAIDVPASPWLLACTFSLACYLGFGKRAHELISAKDIVQAKAQRPVLQRYNLTALKLMMLLLAAVTTSAFALYTISPQTQQFFGTTHLVWTTPFTLLGVLRFYWLVTGRSSADSPTDAMLRDIPFVANLGLWAAAVVAIIYFL